MCFMYFLQFRDVHGLEGVELFSFFVPNFENLPIGSLVNFGLCIVLVIIKLLVD